MDRAISSLLSLGNLPLMIFFVIPASPHFSIFSSIHPFGSASGFAKAIIKDTWKKQMCIIKAII